MAVTGMSLRANTARMGDNLSPEDQAKLVRTARTTVGDELRSLTYFTENTFDQLYLRDDLNRTADLIGFAENERMGFRSKRAYKGTQLGEYEFTIRVFKHGYLTRVIAGDKGAWVTTDGMGIDRFEELAHAIESVLSSL
jgi:hypothetical protein